MRPNDCLIPFDPRVQPTHGGIENVSEAGF